MKPLRIGVLAPIAWRTPPRAYGPWEQVASNLAEGLMEAGHEVTLFATADSNTSAKLDAVVPKGYAEDATQDPKVSEYKHVSHAYEQAHKFDILHNHFDFMGLAYARLISTPVVTTIHGFSSERIVPVYQRLNDTVSYVSISDSDRHPKLNYIDTVYNGINPAEFSFGESPQNHLLYFGRMHPDKGPLDAIKIAKSAGRKLIMAGLIQDEQHWREDILPHIDGDAVRYEGNVGPAQRRELLANASALLHPIHFDEPFGLSVAESMLSGTPVIAYDRGSMPELITNGLSGYRCKDMEEAISACAKTSNINRRACHEYARANFSQDAMVAGYENVYREVLARKSK